MAFVSTTCALASEVRGRGAKFDGYAAEIQSYDKLTGDTTGTVTATTLKRIHAIFVFSALGVLIPAVATITNPLNDASPSVDLTTLGAGLSGTVVIKGSKR